MTSSPAGGEKTSYTLTWETESYTPIIQYRLRYRKFQVDHFDNKLSMFISYCSAFKEILGISVGYSARVKLNTTLIRITWSFLFLIA